MNIALLIKDFAVGKKFSSNGLPTKSGAEFHGENHAKQLMRLGHRVTILTKKRYWFTKGREDFDGIDLVRLHAPFRWAELLLRLFTTHRDIDAFYIIGTPKFAVWAILYAKLRGKPVTLALTGKAEIFERNANWRNRIFGSCVNYIATSHEIARGFVEQGKIDAHRVSALCHGIDAEKYKGLPQTEKQLRRQEMQIPSEAHVLIFCARLVIDKGVDTMLAFWPMIYEKDPLARLIVVGGGLAELTAQLKEMSARCGNSAMIVGEVDAPLQYYQLADVYVHPSRHEAIPTTLLEAMACGLPAVTSDIGGCEDLVFDHDTGFRVNPEAPQEFADRVLYLFAHPEERRNMGLKGAALIRKHCDYGVVIGKLASVIASDSPVSHDWLQIEKSAGNA